MHATIDRLDRTEDGALVVIDYKTGLVKIGDWEGDRPREPQLPLFSVANPQPIDSLCFARIKRGEMSFHGISDSREGIPGVVPSEATRQEAQPWSKRLTLWRQRLEHLAKEFRSGYSPVQPKEGEKTCKFCGLQSLCRVDEGSQEL